jgi:hypothetical protein
MSVFRILTVVYYDVDNCMFECMYVWRLLYTGGRTGISVHTVQLVLESLSSCTWDMNLECNHLNHTVSLVSYRVPLIRDGLLNVGQIDLTQWQSPQPLHGMKILEVGCGGGILTEVRDWRTYMLLYTGIRFCIHLFSMEIFYCWF